MINTSMDLMLVSIAIAVLGLSGFFCYLIYSLTKVVQESRKTVEDVNKKLEKIDPVVDSTSTTISSLLETVDTINNGVLKPVASFSKIIKNFRAAANIFTKKDK